MMKSYAMPDVEGYYGEFGGAYIPEMLYQNVEHLRTSYLEIMHDPLFQLEFNQLLADYVGRPTPLFYAQRLSAQFKTKIYLKREDLCHTGAHKINNTIGQILLAIRLGKKRIIAETGAGQHGVATATALTTDTATATIGTKEQTVTLPASGSVTVTAYATVATAVTGLAAPVGSVVATIVVRDLAAELAAKNAELAVANSALAVANAALAAEKAGRAADKAASDSATVTAKAASDLATATAAAKYKAEYNALATKWNKKFPKLKVALKK